MYFISYEKKTQWYKKYLPKKSVENIKVKAKFSINYYKNIKLFTIYLQI